MASISQACVSMPALAAAASSSSAKRTTSTKSSMAGRISALPKGFKPSQTSALKGHMLRMNTSRNSRMQEFTVRAEGNGNGSTEYDYDFFVIGSGSGGTRASRIATSLGAKAAVCDMPYNPISSDTEGGVGGTCVLRGCVPKKLFIYGSEYTEHFKDSAGFGWEDVPEKPKLTWKTMLDAKNKEIERLHGIYKDTILANAGVEFIQGRGSIVDEHTVDVDGTKYTAKHICVAVGGKPYVLNIPGEEHTITSDEALCLEELPERICIIGGGFIACEFAGIFEGFGSEAHLLYRDVLPLRGFDMECRKFLTEQMSQKGVNVHPGSTPNEIVKNEDGTFTLKFDTKEEGSKEITCDAVMMATGRVPRTQNLGLEKVGVELGPKGVIKVDELSRTNIPSIYAIGDVTDRMNLTPVALMEGMALARTLFGDQGPQAPDHGNIASAVFTQPPLSTVGMTEEEAVEKLGDVDIYTSSFRPMKNTISGNAGRAFMKLVVDAETDVVVGCHMVGPEAAEIMQGMAVAVKMGCTKTQLDTVVGIHPSSAEEFVTMRSKTREIRNKAPVEAK